MSQWRIFSLAIKKKKEKKKSDTCHFGGHERSFPEPSSRRRGNKKTRWIAGINDPKE
jgi:hypothetical protein